MSRPSSRAGTAVTTNSWARRTILARAQLLGFSAESARQVGSIALWYYNRIVLLRTRRDAPSQELPPDTNKYLVPIALALACANKKLEVDLDRMLRLAGNPTRRTIEVAHEWYASYAEILAPTKNGGRAPPRSRVLAASRAASGPSSTPRTAYQVRPPSTNRPPAPAHPKSAAPRTPAAAANPTPLTSLAVAPTSEVQQRRSLFGTPKPPHRGGAAGPRGRQPNTNAWARKRIADLSRRLGLPDHVRNRSLEFYEQIVDLHSKKNGAPPGRKSQLSPRLNWSLVFTTIYLGCRFEEHPKDLRDILGRDPPRGLIREMYGLYRFYKHELRLPIKLVDVRTFILSWLDGFELTELVHEKAAGVESERIKNRAIAIANRARSDKTLEGTATKIIAAGALTTALAERRPPGSRHAFYKAIADFLHMSEETIRYIVARITEIL